MTSGSFVIRAFVASSFCVPFAATAEELKLYFPTERSTQFYPLGVAEALGFFAEENLTLAFVPRHERYDPADYLTNKEIQLAALSMQETVFALGAELPISPVFQMSYVAPYSLVTKEGGPTDAGALKEEKIGLARESDAFIAKASAAAAGLGRDEFETVAIGEDASALGRALAEGSVSALALPDRDRAALEAEGVALRDITPETVAKAPGLALVMHQLSYEDARARVEGFLRAWNKATLVGESDPEVVAAIMRDWVPEDWAKEAFGEALLKRAIASYAQIGAVRGELQEKPWLDAQKPLVRAKIILLPALPSAFLNSTSLEAANDFDSGAVAAAVEKWKTDNADRLQ